MKSGRPFAGSFADLFASLQRGLLEGSYIRTVNFHNTLARRLPEYERQLAFYRAHFCAVSEADLDAFTASGVWHKDKPGLILIFFEGYHNNYEMAPLVERYGFIGWFFIPSRFPSVPPAEQRAFAKAHHIGLLPGDRRERIAMTWDELRGLAKRHVIASHTQTHSRLTTSSTEAELEREIIASKHELEGQLGREVSTFAWLYGSELGVDPRADAYLRRAGYRYLLSNYKIQRLR